MNSLQQLEQAVSQLPPDAYIAFRDWFLHLDANQEKIKQLRQDLALGMQTDGDQNMDEFCSRLMQKYAH